jgi:hypothetical protein
VDLQDVSVCLVEPRNEDDVIAGCDAFQGFIYDPPLSAEEFMHQVREYSGTRSLPLREAPVSREGW